MQHVKRWLVMTARTCDKGLESLLQYYSFERKMKGYNSFSALNRIKGFHFIPFNAYLCLRVLSRIRKNVANTRF